MIQGLRKSQRIFEYVDRILNLTKTSICKQGVANFLLLCGDRQKRLFWSRPNLALTDAEVETETETETCMLRYLNRDRTDLSIYGLNN